MKPENNLKSKTDTLYQQQKTESGSFKFDKKVVDVFDDMISRSVPNYHQIIKLLPTLTRIAKKPNAQYYDLGCSTGAGLVAIQKGLDNDAASLIGVDNSQAMIDQAKQNVSQLELAKDQSMQLLCSDINNISISNAAMVLLNFTLQFIPIDQRTNLLTKIYTGLKPSGFLILSEKLLSKSAHTQKLLTRIHHQYKADQGYSKLEISNKRDAIEDVLIPETLDVHLDRLKECGFKTVTPWVRDLQFVSILAIKD